MTGAQQHIYTAPERVLTPEEQHALNLRARRAASYGDRTQDHDDLTTTPEGF